MRPKEEMRRVGRSLALCTHTLATCITPSIPSSAWSNTPVCSKPSMVTNSSFELNCGRASSISRPFAAFLVAPLTLRPRLRSTSTTWAPMKPVAPVTRTYLETCEVSSVTTQPVQPPAVQPVQLTKLSFRRKEQCGRFKP